MSTTDGENQPSYSGQPNFTNPAFKAYAAAQFLIFAEARLRSKERIATFARYLIIIPYSVLLIVCTYIGYLAYQSESESLIQSYSIEIAAGATIFLAFPLVFRLARWKRAITYISIFIIAMVCAYLSTITSSVTQSFFVEAVSGLILLIALDLGFNYLLELFDKIRIAAVEDAAQFREEIDDAEGTFSPFNGVALGGGTTDETIQFNLIKKNIKICEILLSDEPYLENDLTSTINRVNELKKNDPSEYNRLKANLTDKA